MTPSFAYSLDALSGWRLELVQQLGAVTQFLGDHELVDASAAAQLNALRQRLASEKLVVAFVAEFSRGKSELINAIFFADTGRRVLPATPGRTTMCPVELAWDADEPAALQLLPIETRLEGVSLAEMRAQRRAWTVLPLALDEPQRLAQSLQEVTRTQWVSEDSARALGLWDDDDPQDNPPRDGQGRVEVPAWRHALINYPHPLLQQGLVVLDTPGLNAIGAEPELTLGLLPMAHATVFILGADTGVTRSDLAIWSDHLDSPSLTRFVVLNKIDALADPLATAGQVAGQIESQRLSTARSLGVAPERVFPLSARQALAARVEGDERALQASRLPALEAALAAQLLPQRREVLEQVVLDGVRQLEAHVARRVGDRRRQLAEQLLELRGLRGKTGSKMPLMLQRIEAETAEFEQCTARLHALRVVHARMLRELLNRLASDRLREEVARMQAAMSASLLNLGAKKAFVALGQRLRALLADARQRNQEVRDMLAGSFARLNAEFGFSLALTPTPDLARFVEELGLIERSYVQYLGLTQALRLSNPKFMEQFRRMLVSKLRVVFESASSEIEMWNKAVSAQVDAQLRDRRRGFRRRREALERVQAAAGELQTRLDEVEAQDAGLQQFLKRGREQLERLREHARAGPQSGAPRSEAQPDRQPPDPVPAAASWQRARA